MVGAGNVVNSVYRIYSLLCKDGKYDLAEREIQNLIVALINHDLQLGGNESILLQDIYNNNRASIAVEVAKNDTFPPVVIGGTAGYYGPNGSIIRFEYFFCTNINYEEIPLVKQPNELLEPYELIKYYTLSQNDFAEGDYLLKYSVHTIGNTQVEIFELYIYANEMVYKVTMVVI